MSFNFVDVFKDDIFTVRSMMDYIDSKPYVPEEISKWLPWNSAGELNHLTAIEFRDGVIDIVPDAERGSAGFTGRVADRSAIPVYIPHYPQQRTLLAESVRGVRAFGSELVETFEQKRNEILDAFNVNNRLTWERTRAAAITGIMYKADMTTPLINWFDTFGIAQSTHEIDFGNSNTEVVEELTDAKIKSEEALGDLYANGYYLIAGRNIQKKIKTHPTVKTGYERWNAGGLFRDDVRDGFPISTDINVVTYTRGKIGNHYLIDPDTAYLCPIVQGMYQTRFAPGTGIQTLGAMGVPEYISPKLLDHDEGVELKGQTNPLSYVQRLGAVIKITDAD
ncbi:MULTISPECIES: major capsid protein [Rhizobium]|uniref:major capsid protein n=1 Tax=Rhizobium TaxID=379 RepID=UPI0003F89B0D|nr:MULTISPECIES: major capsid protein [Rhizobium]MBB3520995.1 hypothetical protein [Rhizobium sp. BK456]UFS81557.1 major capsid protein [Rhizobium sp. T136]